MVRQGSRLSEAPRAGNRLMEVCLLLSGQGAVHVQVVLEEPIGCDGTILNVLAAALLELLVNTGWFLLSACDSGVLCGPKFGLELIPLDRITHTHNVLKGFLNARNSAFADLVLQKRLDIYLSLP